MKVPFNNFPALYNNQKGLYTTALEKVIDSGWFILGKEVTAFEKEFAHYLGVKHVIGVANGLEALQLSLLALKIGQGDEVITTPVSAFATTLAILAVGATPVFVDTTSDGLIDPQLVAQHITKKTKAVVPVHLYGNPIEMASLHELCQKHQLYLIEDAAQAHGASWQGQKLGTFGVLNCFSFYPTKNLGCIGDGGAIATDSDELAQLCRNLANYGQARKYVHTQFGLNSRLDELQAAFLQLRLKNLDAENQRRKQIATHYVRELASLQELQFISPKSEGNAHLCVVRTSIREQLQQFLTQQQIETLVHYPAPLPDQPVFKGVYAKLPIPEARLLCEQALSLPCHPYLTDRQVTYVVESIKKFFNRK